MTNQPTTTKEALEPCPKCRDCWALYRSGKDDEEVTCGRCGFNAPYATWQSRHPIPVRYLSELGDSRVSAPIVAPEVDQTIYADGYCARCSQLAYPLTRALENTGVPTGAKDWQQTYGPNKVRALADLETCLRRLLFALEKGEAKEIEDRIQWANHYIEFHAAVRRRLTALAQQEDRHDTPAPASTVAPQQSEPTHDYAITASTQCANCGGGIADYWTYCHRCGADREEAPASPAALRDEAVCKCGLDKDDPIHSFSTERQQMHSFTPKDATTPPSTLAKAAARALYDACLLRDSVVMGPGMINGVHYPQEVATIIERCLAGGE